MSYKISMDLAQFIKVNPNRSHSPKYIYNKLRIKLLQHEVEIEKYKLTTSAKNLLSITDKYYYHYWSTIKSTINKKHMIKIQDTSDQYINTKKNIDI